MSFSDSDIAHCMGKGNFLNQANQLIDWKPSAQAIVQHCASMFDTTGCPAYPGLLLYKMLLVGIWNGCLSSDEAVEDMVNANLHVMRFLGLNLEDDVSNHSVWSRFRTRLTAAHAWNVLAWTN